MANVILITQARVGSTRLPRKVLKEINGKSILQIHLDRIKRCKSVSHIIVATTTNDEDDQIYVEAKKMGFDSYKGSETDVLDRFYKAAILHNPDYIVRVTSDCPLIDPELIDSVVNLAICENSDYCTNMIEDSFPDGQDVEVCSFKALKAAWESAFLLSDREHVTPYIRNNSFYKNGILFKSSGLQLDGNFNHIRMTVDELPDFEAIEHLITHLGVKLSWREYAEYIIKNPHFFKNQKITRNQGYLNSLMNDKNK